MIPPNSEQKKLLFDYCIGLTSKEDTAEVEALISSNQEAAEIHSKIKAILSPLESQECEPCPDDLAERAVLGLNNMANATQGRLQQLLADEQTRTVPRRPRPWVGLGRNLATAAVFMIAGTVLLTTLNYVRYNSRLQRCRMQQSNIFQGLTNYINDNDGRQPVVAAAAGSPWWKVGYQGSENHSNTRNLYLLPKGGYVMLSDFVCPACERGSASEMSPAQMQAYKDFPDRGYVTYSFQISCRRTQNGKLLCRKVVMADWNPIFERLPEDFSKPFKLQLDRKMLSLNSSNHKRRGQNVLFGDGRVEFLKTRFIGTDDIFTLRDTDIYHGSEIPSCESDFFVAP
ncbi:MAG: hypothetical protein ABIF19_21655 [Planctomycetota bacterium]